MKMDQPRDVVASGEADLAQLPLPADFWKESYMREVTARIKAEEKLKMAVDALNAILLGPKA